jgi:hypothetical protein
MEIKLSKILTLLNALNVPDIKILSPNTIDKCTLANYHYNPNSLR